MLRVCRRTAIAANQEFAIIGKRVKQQLRGLGNGFRHHFGGKLFDLYAFGKMGGNALG